MKRRTLGPVPERTDEAPAGQTGPQSRLSVPMVLPAFANTRKPRPQEDAVPGTSVASGPAAPVDAANSAGTTTIAPDVADPAAAVSSTGPTPGVLPLPLAASSQNSPEESSEFYYAQLDAGLIDQNSHPPRSLYLDDEIRIIANSMSVDGQRDAIHVIPHPKVAGRYIIGDGWTRVLATRSYSINGGVLLAKVHKFLNEEQASWLGYSQNKDRNEPTDYDLGCYYRGWNDSGMDWDAIAEKAGVSKSQMSFYASFAKLDPDVLTLVKASPAKFSANVAYQLSRLQGKAGGGPTLSLANRFLSSDQTVKWLKDQVDDALDRIGRGGRKRGDGNTVMFQRRFSAGHYRQRKDGQVEMTVKIAEPRVAEFNKAVEALLKQYLDSSEHGDTDAAPDASPAGG